MKKSLIIIAIGILCVSCGVKDKPEYNSQDQKNKNIYII